MLDGTMSVVQRQRFGVADVRDVADLHIRRWHARGGRRALPGSRDGPTITYLQLAQSCAIRLGHSQIGFRPGSAGREAAELVIHNDAPHELGWRPRPRNHDRRDRESLRDSAPGKTMIVNAAPKRLRGHEFCCSPCDGLPR